jgi:hypothetical protein
MIVATCAALGRLRRDLLLDRWHRRLGACSRTVRELPLRQRLVVGLTRLDERLLTSCDLLVRRRRASPQLERALVVGRDVGPGATLRRQAPQERVLASFAGRPSTFPLACDERLRVGMTIDATGFVSTTQPVSFSLMLPPFRRPRRAPAPRLPARDRCAALERGLRSFERAPRARKRGCGPLHPR